MIELSYKIKLAWVVVLHKSNRHTHDPEIITRDVCRLLHIDGIVVVVMLITDVLNFFVATKLYIIRHGHQLQWFMSPTMVYIREPNHT